MEIETLKNYIEKGYSQREIAKEEKCSQSSVKHWLRKYSLKTNKRSPILGCKVCGTTDLNNFYRRTNNCFNYGRRICKCCSNKAKAIQNRQTKRISIEYKGGKCEKCGYDKCPAALSFHHRDPAEKDLKWKNLKNCSFEKLKTELDKCDLLCHNCHAELHWNLSKLNDWKLAS